MPKLYDVSKFPKKVRRTIHFIMEKEKLNVPIKYDDLAVDAVCRVESYKKTKNKIAVSVNDVITIRHNPTNCEISVEFCANDLHNTLALMLRELALLVDENMKGKLNND